MKQIHKFILHIVHNWDNELNEAYSEGTIRKFLEKFKQEADDLNINITDEQLKIYIERFDVLKNSPKITEKDLSKWSLSKLIKLVNAYKGTDTSKEEGDITPDVVYTGNGIIIYNGSKEDNCLTYGNGERWCITRGSYAAYRYDTSRKQPSFYLVKDTNLPDSDPKSFFVIVVGRDNTYKASDRTNNDVGGRQTEWDTWRDWSFIESKFPSITGLRNIFKYIPLTDTEKINQEFKQKPTNINQWTKFPYTIKEQYLVIRKGSLLFSDISNEEFVIKYLPKYPQISNFIAINSGIIETQILLKHLDLFSHQDRLSITANIREKLKTHSYLESDAISFDIKKVLVKLDKFDLASNQKLYITKDQQAIVEILLLDEIKLNLYTEDDNYENIKINKRTSKYILDYPYIDELPFKYLLDLSAKGIIDIKSIKNIIDSAKEDEDSNILVIDNEDNELILDLNSLNTYKLENNTINKISIDNEETINAIKNSPKYSILKSTVLSFIGSNIPNNINKEGLLSIFKSMNDNERIKSSYIILPIDSDDIYIAFLYSDPNNVSALSMPVYYSNNNDVNWRQKQTTFKYIPREVWLKYFDYMRRNNLYFNDTSIKNILGNAQSSSGEYKKIFINGNPPINADNNYVPVRENDYYYLVNRINPRESFIISNRSSKLTKTSIPHSKAMRLIGAPARTPNPTVPANIGAGERVAVPITQRRGRPAGGGQPRTQIAQPAVPAAQVAQGDGVVVSTYLSNNNLSNGYLNLPRGIRSRINVNNARLINTEGDRGSSNRNNQLGASGTVINTLEIPSGGTYQPSKIYIIRLAGGERIASINTQPGNGNYIITSNNSYQVDNPRQLMNTLRAHNLAEAYSYLVKEYINRNPQHLSEIRELIKQHVRENKKS